MKNAAPAGSILWALLSFSSLAFGEERDPLCLEATRDTTVESRFLALEIADSELLARLIWAEATSLVDGEKAERCEKNFNIYAKAIGWVVRARLDLSKRNSRHRREFGSGWYGVIFKPGQFNPAVSRRSSYQKFFLCPQKSPRFLKHWATTRELADRIVDRHTLSPLVTTPFEIREGYSLVAYLYYPLSTQATQQSPSWIRNLKKQNLQVKGLKLEDLPLSDDCLWMFRAAQ